VQLDREAFLEAFQRPSSKIKETGTEKHNFLVSTLFETGLPDFSCYNAPKCGYVMSQMTTKIPNRHKLKQMATQYTKWS
jgi:hypothetical protein